jgi:hypothetical protein
MGVTVLAIGFAATGIGLDAAAGKGSFSGGELYGRVHGMPAGALFDVVEAVDAHGVIQATAAPGPSGDFKLFVPTGTYLVVTDADGGRGQKFTSASTPVAAQTSVRTPIGLHLKAVKGARASSAPGPVTDGAVVSVGNVSVVDTALGSELVNGTDLRPTLINRFLNLCSPQGTIMVQTSAQFVAYAKQEAALSATGKLSTPFVYKPIRPQFTITGEAEVTRTENPVVQLGLTVKLRITDLRSGHVVATATAGIPQSKPPLVTSDVLGALGAATDRLAQAGCGANLLVGP